MRGRAVSADDKNDAQTWRRALDEVEPGVSNVAFLTKRATDGERYPTEYTPWRIVFPDDDGVRR